MEAVPRNGATINEMLDDFEKNIIEGIVEAIQECQPGRQRF
jgi:hypothetical protein